MKRIMSTATSIEVCNDMLQCYSYGSTPELSALFINLIPK